MFNPAATAGPAEKETAMKLSTLIAAGLVAATLPLATAAASADQIDRRQAEQERRIQQGVRSGELTRGEYRQLEAEQARIREMERRAKADGHVDRAERARIEAAQNAASRHIYQEKHDSETRRGWFR